MTILKTITVADGEEGSEVEDENEVVEETDGEDAEESIVGDEDDDGDVDRVEDWMQMSTCRCR